MILIKQRLKDSSKNLALLVGALLFAAFLGEIAVRIAAPQQLIVPNPHLWRPDPIVGWRHVENANTQINTGEGMVHFRSDENGYRINYLDEDAAPADPEISILALGDSFLEAIQVESKETIPQLLQQRLTQVYQKPVEVVNAGLDGWNPNQYLIESRQILSRRSFDLGIVFLYVGNDIAIERTRISISDISSLE
jgi:hypothetical protein